VDDVNVHADNGLLSRSKRTKAEEDLRAEGFRFAKDPWGDPY
jgi:hypothetical protein